MSVRGSRFASIVFAACWSKLPHETLLTLTIPRSDGLGGRSSQRMFLPASNTGYDIAEAHNGPLVRVMHCQLSGECRSENRLLIAFDEYGLFPKRRVPHSPHVVG